MSGVRGGSVEIRFALAKSRRLFEADDLFSAFVDLPMLAGPIFMLQIRRYPAYAKLRRAGVIPASESGCIPARRWVSPVPCGRRKRCR